MIVVRGRVAPPVASHRIRRTPEHPLKVLPFPDPRQARPDAADAPDAPTPIAAVPALQDEEPRHYDRITVRAITAAVVLSLFVHLVLLLMPLLSPIDQEMKAPADEQGPLSVTIAQSTPQPPAPQPRQEPPAAQPVPQQPTPPQPAARPPTPVPTPRPRPAQRRPQIAINSGRTPPFVVPAPAPQQPAPQPQPQPPAPTPAPVTPTTDDFSEALAARQRARRAQNGGAPDEVVESDDARANRIARANIAAQQRSASPGQDPDQAGGIFDLRHTGINEAEFVFNGWNRTFRRSVGQTFEVKVGNNPDIRIAVIRQMIAIIREQKPGDFEWHSHRLNRVVTMSARPQDQKELETFLLKEFYADDPRAR